MTIFNKLFVVYSMIKQKNISMSYLLCYNISGDYMKYPTPIQNKENYKKAPKVNGVIFENALNISNEYYRLHDIAFIYKKPTPVQIVRVDYPQRTKAKITEAYYKTPSTTDYNGIYRGKYIDPVRLFVGVHGQPRPQEPLGGGGPGHRHRAPGTGGDGFR